ncbi:hypothetical protein B0H14DRAFT_3909943 [Mycena olivaceomarginata]|nr:hypothetical protein B0H14DRAFT_3909943 [Mycena olivaceomarginata]
MSSKTPRERPADDHRKRNSQGPWPWIPFPMTGLLLDLQESDGLRNFLHHPRPDRDTAMDRVADFLDDETQNTLHEFLETHPKRLPSRRERTQVADPDLFLFAEEGNEAAQKGDLENLRAERADTEAYLEALEQEAA